MKRFCKQFTRLMVLLMVATAGIALASCNSDDPTGGDISGSETSVIYNIVTYEGTSADNVTKFTFRESDDSVLITLTAANWAPSKEIDAGTRLLLAYTASQQGISSTITVLSAQLIYGGMLAFDDRDETTSDVVTDAIWLNSMWRDGHYINLDCKVDYAVSPARFALVADNATLTDAYPTLYLIHSSGEQFGEYSRRLYASWDIDAVWSLPTCQGVTIRFRDSNRNLSSATFSKK